jgi:hypothetical protein
MRQAQPLPEAPVTDFAHPEPEMRHENDYVPRWAPIRMILAGASGCGKTVLVDNLLIKYDFLNAERIFFITASPAQLYYSQMQDLIDTTPEYQDKIQIIDHLVPIEELGMDEHERNCIFIDDFIEQAEDPMLTPYFTRSRHYNADVLFTTQALYLVPPSYRRNSNMIAIFRGACDQKDTRIRVWRDHFNDIPIELFDHWYIKYILAPQNSAFDEEECGANENENRVPNSGKSKKRRRAAGSSTAAGRHDFLLIDYETPNRFLKYRHGLHEYLPVPVMDDVTAEQTTE